MARLLTTNDPYTSYGSYSLIDAVITWTVYDPSNTSYDITNRDQPFCFFHTWLTEISVKDNSWLFTVDLTSSVDNFVCTSTPLIWQTTELIILNSETLTIKVAPESVINALYRVPTVACDWITTFCVEDTQVEAFCMANSVANTGSIDYLTYDLLNTYLTNADRQNLYSLWLNESGSSYMSSTITDINYNEVVLDNMYSFGYYLIIVIFWFALADFVYLLYKKIMW